MGRLIKTILLGCVIAGGIWVLVHRDQIHNLADVVSLFRSDVMRATGGTGSDLSDSGLSGHGPSPVGDGARADWDGGGEAGPGYSVPTVPAGWTRSASPPLPRHPVADRGPVIRIASLKLAEHWATDEIGDRLRLMTRICRNYDVIALQGLGQTDPRSLQALVESLNAKRGERYRYLQDSRDGRGHATSLAIVFNQRTVELDQGNWYTVDDPDNLLLHKPLVGWFRTRMPNPEMAFTFTLVNVELAPVRPDRELARLADLFRAVRKDGRGEDDVILCGDFNSSDRGLERIRERAGLTWVVSNRPTDIQGRRQSDNVVFSQRATVEYTGLGGVFDFIRAYNLRLRDVSRITDHLPVWAEFSAIEGGRNR